ncbi:two-component system sporulation sensor kinase B [Neobacillus niacini]|uniref:HAMP domain-containing sensor histidine kinase n=1 Tax=Neobacillus driksii TaxID=3035913 RepID=UPI0027881381|nr:HAMP domain-containing sensor histidine kinase [Neobacillus niacini]MDQ0973220.1 two-component system sporulation sensor kinase B [Neobacillus niacini]
MEITKHLFLNLSILIILLLFCLIWLDRSRKITLSKTTMIIISVLVLWICIQFSYNPVPYARYDLRIIPIVIGGLYLGIGLIIVVAMIIIRSFYGLDTGLLATILLYVPLAITFFRLTPWFWKQSSNRRISVAIFLGIILGILTTWGELIRYTGSPWYDVLLAFFVIPPLGIGLIAYSIEYIKKSVELRLQLIKVEKLKAVEQMGAAISHEIRNPLTAASGFVQLLNDDYLPRHKRREYLSIVKDELQSAERVIQDYLTFAKPSLASIEELNVKNELKQIINIVTPMANQNSVEIITDFSVIGFIKGDRQRFRQCFINILKNAVEAMPNGGQLYIETNFSQDYVTICIKDTGIGMTSEQLERLGEPYYSTKGKNGTGLGMMVVYSIVRAMHGLIKVESELGAGTTFYIKFPTITLIQKSEN